jgi:hypothetical protein
VHSRPRELASDRFGRAGALELFMVNFIILTLDGRYI